MTWKPDPSFIPPRAWPRRPPRRRWLTSPRSTGPKTPDAIAVVDVDPRVKILLQIISTTPMPNAGDELHHFGWNACSSCLCPNAPHPHVERRYLVVPGLRSSRIHILTQARSEKSEDRQGD